MIVTSSTGALGGPADQKGVTNQRHSEHFFLMNADESSPNKHVIAADRYRLRISVRSLARKTGLGLRISGSNLCGNEQKL